MKNKIEDGDKQVEVETFPGNRTLASKLCDIMGECKGVAMAGRNEHQSYNYMKAADVADTIRALLVKHRVIMLPSTDEHKMIQYTNQKQATVNYVSCTVNYLFIDAENPTDTIILKQAAHGADTNGDKGIYKALTGAHKYMLRQAFCLGTEDDAERDEGMHPEVTKPTIKNIQEPQILNNSVVGNIIMSGKLAELGEHRIETECQMHGMKIEDIFAEKQNWVTTTLANPARRGKLTQDDRDALVHYAKYLEALQ